MSQQSIEFREIDRDAWMVQRLRELGRKVFDGDTNPAIRCERIRQAIIDGNLDCVIIGRSKITGKAETFEACFERLYGVPLFATIPVRKTG